MWVIYVILQEISNTTHLGNGILAKNNYHEILLLFLDISSGRLYSQRIKYKSKSGTDFHTERRHGLQVFNQKKTQFVPVRQRTANQDCEKACKALDLKQKATYYHHLIKKQAAKIKWFGIKSRKSMFREFFELSF